MKILVTESQYNKILREEKEQKIFRVPGLDFFHEYRWEAWDILQKVLEHRGNPPYTFGGDLDLSNTSMEYSTIESLGNLTSVEGDLDLRYTQIESLGNLISVGGDLDLYETQIKSLGNLTSVGGYLDLRDTPIKSLGNLEYVGRTLDVQKTSIDSLGKLQYVGGDLNLYGTPLSDKFSYTEIKEVVNVMGAIFM